MDGAAVQPIMLLCEISRMLQDAMKRPNIYSTLCSCGGSARAKLPTLVVVMW